MGVISGRELHTLVPHDLSGNVCAYPATGKHGREGVPQGMKIQLPIRIAQLDAESLQIAI
ncbi:MAG: hypothetical protein WC360_06970 [Opitutales bacterium]